MGYGVPDSGVDVDFINPTQAHAMLKSDKALFVDGRDIEDYQRGHICTAYTFPSNNIFFYKDKLDATLVARCKSVAEKGKVIICVSDAGITGLRNRGHVSRCRHVAQYLVEMGVPRENVRRLLHGMNAWKSMGLDGILGDYRCWYAGALLSSDQRRKCAQDALQDKEDGLEVADELVEGAEEGDAPKDDTVAAPAAEPAASASSTALVPVAAAPAGDKADDHDVTDSFVAVSTRAGPADATKKALPEFVESPTVYRVLLGEIFKKASPEVEKIISFKWPVDRLVRCTGNVHVGASGGKWAELDENAGEKKGWVYVGGPGFGPTTRKIVTEYMTA